MVPARVRARHVRHRIEPPRRERARCSRDRGSARAAIRGHRRTMIAARAWQKTTPRGTDSGRTCASGFYSEWLGLRPGGSSIHILVGVTPLVNANRRSSAPDCAYYCVGHERNSGDAIHHDSISSQAVSHSRQRRLDLRPGAGAPRATGDAWVGAFDRRRDGERLRVEDQRLEGEVGPLASPGAQGCTRREGRWRYGDGSARVQRLSRTNDSYRDSGFHAGSSTIAEKGSGSVSPVSTRMSSTLGNSPERTTIQRPSGDQSRPAMYLRPGAEITR